MYDDYISSRQFIPTIVCVEDCINLGLKPCLYYRQQLLNRICLLKNRIRLLNESLCYIDLYLDEIQNPF